MMPGPFGLHRFPDRMPKQPMEPGRCRDIPRDRIRLAGKRALPGESAIHRGYPGANGVRLQRG